MFREGLWSTGASQSLLARLKLYIVFWEIVVQAHQHVNREGLCRGSPYCADFLRWWGKERFEAMSQSLNEKSCSPEDWKGPARNSDGQLIEMHKKVTSEDWINWLQLEKELGRAKMPHAYSSSEGLLSARIWTASAQGCRAVPSDNSHSLLCRDSVFKET